MKPLPSELKYSFLGDDETCLIVISLCLHKQQEGKFLDILRKQREAFRWTIFDLERVSPLESTHHTHMEDDPGEVYLLDIIIEEVADHMSYENEVRESYPLKFDYEEPTIFDLG